MKRAAQHLENGKWINDTYVDMHRWGDSTVTKEPTCTEPGEKNCVCSVCGDKKDADAHIADSVYDYIARLAEATRNHPMIQLGISPRGALALCRVAKARAFVQKRDFVTPADVKVSVKDVFAHRLILSSKARLNEYSAEMLVDEILTATKMPAITEKNL